MIEIKNLHKSYRRGKEIIPDLNLTFGETGLNMIVGKSGCGKTTLLNIIGSMDLDFEGQVIVDGKDLSKCSYKEIVDYRNFTSAFVFQKNSLFEFLTVEENLKLCMNIQNNTADISDALEKVGLKGFEHKKVKSLSGGEKQRVAIARALIKNCKIIFADEPTSALDTKNAHKIFQLFKEISKDKLVILVTHDLKKAVLYADRIVRFVDGVPVDDTTYNQVATEARVLPERSTKKLALLPIFKNHLKKGMSINLFIIILLIAAITVANLAMAGKKVKDEYDTFGTAEQVEFNADRAIETQIKNNIDLFNVVKATDTSSPYVYLQNSISGETFLNKADSLILSNLLNESDIYYGSVDSLNNKLAIDGISTVIEDQITFQSAPRYWNGITFSDYIYYLYNDDCNYNLIEGGRLPNSNNKNEILISDVVAWHYIQKNGLVVNNNDDDPTAYNPIYDVDFVIFDSYGSYEVSKGTLAIGEPNHYKVVGVIDTGLLDFYTFNLNQNRYLFNTDFKTQDNDKYATFMNSAASQPFGYVVLQEPLKGATENAFLYNNFKLENITINSENGSKQLSNSTIAAFVGGFDYALNPAEAYWRTIADYEPTWFEYDLTGYEDDLIIDAKRRIVTKSTSEADLIANEVIISKELAAQLFPEYQFSTNVKAKESFDYIADTVVTVTYSTGRVVKSMDVIIVGLCENNTGTMMYVSNEIFNNLYQDKYIQDTAITLDLNGYNLRERKEIMKKLYNAGYCLSPVDVMPGSYLEFVDGKGETYAEVDGEGLQSLYPYHTVVEENGTYYFENNGMRYGFIDSVSKDKEGNVTSIGTVYMTSTMVKRIALDESYITKNIGNLSLYYLFSDYYTYEDTNTGNYILEIMGGMYVFLLGMATAIAIGFIYLKENKEKDSMTKLSMLGVRPGHIYIMHLITYVAISVIITLGVLVCTYVFVNIINGLFTYGFESGAVIHRVRLLFESSAVYTTLLIVLGFFILSMISSIFVTFKSRK